MTIQELQGKIRPYIKEDVPDTVWNELSEGVQLVVNDSIAGVIENKEKILGEKKDLQKKFEELHGKFKPFEENGVSFEEFSKIKQEYEVLKSKPNDGNSENLKKIQEQYYEMGKNQRNQEVQPLLKELQEKMEMETKKAQEVENRYINNLMRAEITKTIRDIGVEADDFWLQGFLSTADHEYNPAEDKVNISVRNPQDPSGPKIPLRDWAKLYPQTPQGKSMIKAPRNTGAGATGANGRPNQAMTLESTLESLFAK